MLACSNSFRRATIAAAVSAVALIPAHLWANDNSTIGPGLAVISLSGSTAIKNLYTASGNGLFSLEPLNVGTNASPVFQQTSITFSNGTYFSAANANGSLNLAPTTYSTANLGNGSTGPGLLIETHEQGSVEGIYEMAQDQLTQYGYTPPALATVAPRFPTAANPIHINGSGPTVTTTPSTPNGFTFTANQVQDPVTMAQSDVNHVQGFGVTSGGAPANTAKPWASVPGQNGYGQGNPAFAANVNALGAPNIAAQMIPNTALTGTVNGVAHNYYNDLEDTVIAKTATTFAANPGTGLTRVNAADAQFLETSSRLANGVVFNFTSRDVNSGTRNVSALNTGIDPSWAVGKNDAGNGLAIDGSDKQTFIGQGLTFSNKTAGGGELRPTVQNSRMAIGTLGQPDVGTRATGANGTLRVLDFGNATTDSAIAAATNANLPNSVNASGVVVGTQWSRVSLANIMTGTYTISQNENFVDFKATAANNTAGQTTGILGDDQTATFTGDTLTLRNMITSSAGLFPSGSFNGPAATMLKTGYVPLVVSAVDRQYDGQAFSANDGTINNTAAFNQNLAWGGAAGTGTVQNPAPDSVLGTAAFNNANFHVDAPGTVTAVGDKYGNNTGSNARAGFTGANEFTNVGLITITDTNAGSDSTLHQTGNWLVGNFNQTGSRDLADVETAVFAQQALFASGTGSNLNRVSSLGADAQGNLANGESTRANSSDVSWAGFITGNIAAITSAGVGTGMTALSTMTPQGGVAIGADKGDLILLGDVNGDGRFDGKDLYLLAEGAAVSDAPHTAGYAAGTLTLTSYNATTGAGGFGDAIRSATLRKNDALDFVNTYSAQQQKNDAQVTFTLTGTGTGAPSAPAGAVVLTTTGTTITYTYDAAGVDNHSVNAFKKEDVNRDGLIDINDAIVVDNLAAVPNAGGTGTHAADYTSLDDQLSAGTVLTAGKLRTFNLTDAKLVDGTTTTIGSEDLAVVNTALTGAGNSKWFAGSVAKTGPGAITFARTSGMVAIDAGAVLTITNGQITANSAVNPFKDSTFGATNGSLLPITVNGTGTLEVGGGVKEVGTLTVSGAGTAVVGSGVSGTPNVLVASSLSLGGTLASPSGKIALSPFSGAVIHAGYSADQTRQLVQAGYSGGAWSGSGITVASAATSQGVGYLTGAQYAALHGTTSFNGATVGSTDVVLKYTYMGDATLDGKITIADYAQIDAGFLLGATSPGWFDGDFDYNGVVDYRDYALLDLAASAAGSPLAAGEIAAHEAEFGAAYETFLQAAAPEPATLTLMTIGALLLLRRRRF